MDAYESVMASSQSKHVLKVAAYDLFQRRSPLEKLSDVYEKIAANLHISVSSAKRYVQEIREYGYVPIVKSKQGRTAYAWSREALDFMVEFYLIAHKQGGSCTFRNAYRETVKFAAKNGLKVGSEPSAYIHLRKLNDATVMYAMGGRRALDNMFYISRDLASLKPFQVIVGDQHRFDFWVSDPDNPGEYFRPECYLWLDMRTRLVYGISFDKNYNTRTVLRALRVGVERYGKFDACYNDNGSSEKSKVADFVIDQLISYGMAFGDVSEMYKTPEGKYILEDSDGNTLEVCSSQKEWQKKHRRIFANVKNAKTKPIERFFRTLEQILLDLCLPGYIRELGMSVPEEEEAQRRLDWQKKNGFLLTPKEFYLEVLKAIEIYHKRKHGTLNKTPVEELETAVKLEGWQPTFINAEDIQYLFLERAFVTVKGDRIQLNNRQYVGPNITSDMIKHNRGTIVGLNRQKVEIRYDAENENGLIFAIHPDTKEIIQLRPVEKISFFDETALEQHMKNKQSNIRAVTDAFKDLTGGKLTVLTDRRKTSGYIEAQKLAEAAAQIESIETVSESGSTLSLEEFQSAVAGKIAVEISLPKQKTIYKTPRDRYEAILQKTAEGKSISAEDTAFRSQFESTLTAQERDFFQQFYVYKKESL